MATRTRGDIPARQKPPPSHLPQTGTIQHPDSSKTNSFAQKQIPTHLKSANISTQQSTRSTPGDTAHKPTVTRRSTFHDLASPSTTQNTRVSPNPTLRPSTFSRKTATTQKTDPSRKPSSLYTRPVSGGKKRFIYVKKQDIGTSAATTKEQFRSPHFPQPEPNPKDQESFINEAKEVAIQVGSSNDNETKADHVLAQEDIPDPISNAQTKAENGKDVDLQNDKQDTALVVKTEATENVSQVAEIVSNSSQEFSEARDIDEINSSKTHENVVDNPTSEAEKMNKEPEKTEHKKEAVGTESELAPETKETEAQEVGRETENKAVPKGKKGSVVSNDVIEETASKLREQRKNKVKALAGAFETVISLQENK